MQRSNFRPRKTAFCLPHGPVAGLAAGLQVGAAQRVAGLLVEDLLLGDAADPLPVVGRVAGLAGGAEAPQVRILVAVGAGLERDRLVAGHERGPHRRGARAEIAGRRRRLVGVALHAGHLGVLQLAAGRRPWRG